MDAFQRWDYIPESMFDVHLNDCEQIEFDKLLTSIRTIRDKTPTEKAFAYQELLVFNKSGKKTPIFWCFNNWAEPYLLARQLPVDQPLIAVHSPHGHEANWCKKARYTDPLAKKYVKSASELFSSYDFIIGGNCQGAPIAESAAIQIAQEQGIYPQLITIDYTQKRYYQGPILMIFGSESPFNPFSYKKDPIPFWQKKLKSFQWKFLNTTHGSYFREPTIIRFKDYVSETAKDIS